MPRDDREFNFHQALARHLRTPATPASAPAPNPPDCSDPETLAAYHDHLLAPEEMTSRRRHIDACPRCQAILERLEASGEIADEILAESRAQVPEEVPMAAASPDFAYLAAAAPELRVLPPRAIPSEVLQSSNPNVPEAAKPVQMPRRSANWRRLGFVGTLAAVLLLWVAVHEKRPSFEIAKNQQSPPQMTAALPPAPPAAASPKDSVSATSAGDAVSNRNADAVSAANAKAAANSRLSSSMNPRPAPSSTFGAAGAKPAQPELPSRRTVNKPVVTSPVNGAARAMTSPSAYAGAAPGLVQPPAVAEPKQKAPDDSSATLAKSLPLDSPAPAANTVIVAAAPPSPRLAKKETSSGQPSEATLLNAQSNVTADTFETRPAVSSQVRNPISITSPDGSVTWRLLPAGMIQRSTDSGATWSLQKSGVVVDLLAGSATSAKVCWVAGRNGTILRTTDGGAQWRQISSPTKEDLPAIFAIDDRQATVITPTQLYSTINAGKTWTPHPKP
jgi:hypothetical protein